MSAAFADTFYWIALINPADRYSQAVQRFDDLLSGSNVCTTYTTEDVLVEVPTFFAADTWLKRRRETRAEGWGLLLPRVDHWHPRLVEIAPVTCDNRKPVVKSGRRNDEIGL